MAELAASIIGIVSAGTKVTLVLSQLAADVGSAAKEAGMIGNEIRSFCAVVKTLGETLEKVQNSQYYAHCSDLVGDMTDASLEMFTEILNASESIRTMARGKGGKFGLVGRVQWAVFKKPKITLLRTALEAYKSNLALMLGTLDTTEKVNRRLSLKITPEVIAEDQKDREVLQKLEDEQRASLANVNRLSLLLSEGGLVDAGDDEIQLIEDAAETTPLIQEDPEAVPATEEFLTDSLLGSVRDEINSIRSSLSRFSTLSSEFLQDRVSRHSKTLSLLMENDQHRFSQRWSSILDPVWEDQSIPLPGNRKAPNQWTFQFPTLPEEYPTSDTSRFSSAFDRGHSPAPSRSPSGRSPASSPAGVQRNSILSDTFYDIVRTWLLEKPLEDRRVILGTLMNDVCVAPQKSATILEPENPSQSRSPSPNPQTRRSPSPSPFPPPAVQKSEIVNRSSDALTQYRQKAREINSTVKEQFQKYAAGMKEQGYNTNTPPADAPGFSIDLGHKQILKMPHEIVEVVKTVLERFSLSHNRLMDLPANLALCSRLRYLNLRANNLVSIPDPVLELPQLEILDMSRNMLSDIPQALIRLSKTLKVISVEKNKITRLPHWLPYMEKLVVFKWEGNPLVYPSAPALESFTRKPLPTENENAQAKSAGLSMFTSTDAYYSTRRLLTFLRPVEATPGPTLNPAPKSQSPKPKQSPRYPVKPAQASRNLSHVPNILSSGVLALSGQDHEAPAFRSAMPKRDTFGPIDISELSSSPASPSQESEIPPVQDRFSFPIPSLPTTPSDDPKATSSTSDAPSQGLLIDPEPGPASPFWRITPAQDNEQRTTQGLGDIPAASLSLPPSFAKPWSPPRLRSHSDSTTPTSSVLSPTQMDSKPRPRSFLGVPNMQNGKVNRNSVGSIKSLVSYLDDV